MKSTIRGPYELDIKEYSEKALNGGGNPNHDPGSGRFTTGGGSSGNANFTKKEKSILDSSVALSSDFGGAEKVSVVDRLSKKGFISTQERVKVNKALSDAIDAGAFKGQDKASIIKVASKVSQRELYKGKFKGKAEFDINDNSDPYEIKALSEKTGLTITPMRTFSDTAIEVKGPVGKIQKYAFDFHKKSGGLSKPEIETVLKQNDKINDINFIDF